MLDFRGASAERIIESSGSIQLNYTGLSTDSETITVTPSSMTVSASLVDSGDGIFCSISSDGSNYSTSLSSVSADSSGDWTLYAKAAKFDNTSGNRTMKIRLVDDSNSSNTLDVNVSQMTAPT